MSLLSASQQSLLDDYISTFSANQIAIIAKKENVQAECFCGDEYNANECARLIDKGLKTASCSLKAAWGYVNEPLPKFGTLTIVTNWEGEPVSIIQLTNMTTAKFCDVTSEFAKSEGEGDGSLKWWQDAHSRFFSDYALTINSRFNTNSELVLEHFVKVYPV